MARSRRLAWFFLCCLLLGAGVAGWIYRDYQAFLEAPLVLPSEGVNYQLKRGASIDSVAREWQRQGLLQQAQQTWYLIAYARLSDQATRIKAGEYHIPFGADVRSVLADFVAGRTLQYSLTIPEGWTFRQMLQALQEHPQIIKTLPFQADNQAIMTTLGLPEQHPEGLFFPETYHFPRGTTDVDFLRRAHQVLQQKLDTVWQARQADLPLENAYQALILASIIEKETGRAGERRRIAGVFIRRLRQDMRLQTDPTVIYGLGDTFDGNLRRVHLRTDNPYNTYTRKGLPPTPIALPGLASLQAAVDPAPGDALYFVANGEGGHVFSKTLREHNKAVRRYQR